MQIEPEKVAEFYDDVIKLCRPGNKIIECEICDGCSYELTFTYSDKRKKKMQGDLGEIIDKTIMDFIGTIPEIGVGKRLPQRLRMKKIY